MLPNLFSLFGFLVARANVDVQLGFPHSGHVYERVICSFAILYSSPSPQILLKSRIKTMTFDGFAFSPPLQPVFSPLYSLAGTAGYFPPSG